MFSVAYSPEFNEAQLTIIRNLFFAFQEDPILDEFDKAFDAALVNVQTFPEAYRRTGKGRRHFTFEHRSVPYTVLYTFDGELITLHDIHFARSARTAFWLME